jgi:hypothetical protein
METHVLRCPVQNRIETLVSLTPAKRVQELCKKNKFKKCVHELSAYKIFASYIKLLSKCMKHIRYKKRMHKNIIGESSPFVFHFYGVSQRLEAITRDLPILNCI